MRADDLLEDMDDQDVVLLKEQDKYYVKDLEQMEADKKEAKERKRKR